MLDAIAPQIQARIQEVQATLPPTVRLIAVTKQVSVEAMRAAYAAGVRDFGENRVQEAIAKQAQLQDLPDITWHLIGHLQTNKARKALECFHWIHSLDSLALAQHLNRLAQELAITPQVCLQVKLLPDPQKFGWSASELLEALPALAQCPQLQIRGLMAIPPLGLEDAQILTLFHQARELATHINQTALLPLPLEQLSLGMSQDYPLAIAAGSTMIRLGRTLFGERVPSPLPN